MPKRRFNSYYLVITIVLGLVGGTPATAAEADWPRSFTITAYNAKPLSNTAYSLRAREAQIGLITQSYGITNRFTVSTTLAGWLLPLFIDAFAPNLTLRYRFADTHRWSFALESGVTWIRINELTLADPLSQNSELMVIPFTARASHRAQFGLLSSFEASYILSEANLEDSETVKAYNAGVVGSNLNFAVALEQPVSRRWALTLTSRVVAWAPKGYVSGSAQIDPFNRVSVRGTLTSGNVAGSYNVIGGFAFYARRLFRFRIGAGYGTYILPTFGFVSLDNGLVVDLATYFRF